MPRAARRATGLAALALAIPAAGCSWSGDGEQIRLCRMLLPALIDEAAGIRILSEQSAGREAAILFRQGQSRVPGRLVCRFAGRGFIGSKRDLVAAALDGRPLGPSALFFLTQHWLASQDSIAADPGPAGQGEARALPRWAALALQHGLGALPKAGIYALLAAAYALLYGLIGRINLAFGEFGALGGLTGTLAILAGAALGLDSPAIGLAAGLTTGLAVMACGGFVFGRLIAAPLALRPGQHLLVASVGLMVALQEAMRLAQGSGTRWLAPVLNTPLLIGRAGPDFMVVIPPVSLLTAATAFGAALFVLALLRFSRFGRDWRASAQEPLAAALCGVSAQETIVATAVLASILAGLAGFLTVVQYGGIGFAGGTALGLTALLAAIAGGIGSVGGAMLGGLLIGAIETLWSAVLPITDRETALYALLALFLVLRPGGLFGFADSTPRRV